MLILDLWGISFHAVVVFGLRKDLLSKSVLGHCALCNKSYLVACSSKKSFSSSSKKSCFLLTLELLFKVKLGLPKKNANKNVKKIREKYKDSNKFKGKHYTKWSSMKLLYFWQNSNLVLAALKNQLFMKFRFWNASKALTKYEWPKMKQKWSLFLRKRLYFCRASRFIFRALVFQDMHKQFSLF